MAIHLLALMVVPSLFAAPNLAPNPSFEAGADKPDGWVVWPGKGIRMWRDDTVAHTGHASVAIDIGPDGAKQYPSCRFAVKPVRAGQMYEASAWIRTRHATDIGGYVCLEGMHGNDRLGFASSAFTMGGDHDWTRLTVRYMVPPGADLVWFTLVAHGQGKVWFDDAEVHLSRDAPADTYHGGEVRLTLDRSTAGQTLLGFGAHGDFFLTRRINTARGVDDRDRALIFDRVRAMRPAIVRTLFDYSWWEPEEGRYTPDSEALRDYVTWCRFLKSIGASVILCPWGDYFAYPPWLRDGNHRLPPPDKREAMLRSLVDVVSYLRRDEGLDNVRYLCLMNEPANDPTRAFPAAELVRLNRELDRLLRERGLRKSITLLGVDECTAGPLDVSAYLRQATSAGLGWCDVLSVHTYIHRYTPSILPWLQAHFRLVHKPVLLTEFGYGGSTFDNPENGKYEYGLFLPDLAIEALKGGASGALVWCLMDTYYTDDLCQHWGLWQYKDKGWAPRPGFYSWSLVTRYTRAGSRYVPVRLDPMARDLHVAALRTPGGQVTVLVVNHYPEAVPVRLDLGAKHLALLHVFRYTREAVASAGGSMLQQTGALPVDEDGRTQSIDLAPESFTVLTELN